MSRLRIAIPATALACVLSWLAWTASGWLLPHVGLEDVDFLARGGAVILALGLTERLFAALTPASFKSDIGTDL